MTTVTTERRGARIVPLMLLVNVYQRIIINYLIQTNYCRKQDDSN